MTERGRYLCLLLGLGVLAAALFVASLTVGPAGFGFRAAFSGLFSHDAGAIALIMQEIRLPRALLGLAIGATLGLSGAVLQGYLRNPLAEPGLLGVSASASLGAVIAIYTGLSALFALALPVLALVFAVLSVVLVRFLAGGGARSLSIILAGVAVTSFAGAMTALAGLRAPVDTFFEDILVNADDPALRMNRLRLLAEIREATRAVADFSKIAG